MCIYWVAYGIFVCFVALHPKSTYEENNNRDQPCGDAANHMQSSTDSRPKGRGFEPHRRHCVVVLEQDTFILA